MGEKSVRNIKKSEGRDGKAYKDLKSESVGWHVVGCFLGLFGMFGDEIDLVVG
jgi:hypothetical protein